MALMTRHTWRLYGRRFFVTALLSLALLAHALGSLNLGLVDTLEDVIYDQRLRLAMPHTLDDRVVIIDIDEPSLSRIGQWPWARNRLEALVRELVERQEVAALGLDTVLGESDRSSALPALWRLASVELQEDEAFSKWLTYNAAKLDYDRHFAATLRDAPVALAFYLTADRGGHRFGALPEPVLHMERPQGMLEWNGYSAPIEQLARAARGAGFINSTNGRDGVVRAAPLLASLDDGIYVSLALATLQQAYPKAALRIARVPGAPNGAIHQLQLLGGDSAMTEPVHVQPSGTALVPYRGAGGPQGGSFRYISAADVIEGKLSKGELRGRIALLGFTVPGLMDLRATPVDAAYPGVEVHASMISGMLDGRVPYVPDWARGFRVSVMLLLGVLLTALMPRLKVGRLLSLGAVLATALVALDVMLFFGSNQVLPLAGALLLVLSALTANLVLGFFFESRARYELAQQFATYVPPDLVQQMQRNPDDYGMQAESRELTVMFCDLIGFTSMAEGMKPNVLQEQLNRIFSALSAVISTHHGTIDKYMGDCVMAFWGAPVPNQEHARQAVDAALGMTTALQALAREQVEGELPISAGIGLNTGEMFVGNMGSDVRRAYTVIGDAVNLASRLEALTRKFGVGLIASDSTRAQTPVLPPGCFWQELGSVRVKGRQKAVTIHTVRVSENPDDTDALVQELALWHEALADWRRRGFGPCWAKIRELRQQNDNFFLYQMYEKQVISALRQPVSGDDWDGTLQFDEK